MPAVADAVQRVVMHCNRRQSVNPCVVPKFLIAFTFFRVNLVGREIDVYVLSPYSFFSPGERETDGWHRVRSEREFDRESGAEICAVN